MRSLRSTRFSPSAGRRAVSAMARAATVVAVSACAPVSSAPPSLPAPPRDPKPSALQQVVEAYHERGDLEPMKAWLREHPDDPDALIWQEVVALRQYDRLTLAAVEEADPDAAEGPMFASSDPDALADLAEHYPGTYAGDTAKAVLEHRAMQTLLTGEPTGALALAFLDGRDEWMLDADGQPIAPTLDVEAFRTDKEEVIRQRAGDDLIAGGCKGRIGVCTWWIERYPDAPQTAAIRADIDQLWWHRAHPPWQGKAHLQCAFDCARTCKAKARPLDDSCYPACYSRC